VSYALLGRLWLATDALTVVHHFAVSRTSLKTLETIFCVIRHHAYMVLKMIV